MAGSEIGPLGRAWLKWKSLRLPWRKRFFVGFDLDGNTYWEFRLLTRGSAAPRPGESSERWRRIVQYPRSTQLSAVRVGPLWHQWLRHVRDDPPSLDEQRGDVARRIRMQRLAAEADARWAAKPRVMQAPDEPAAAAADAAPHDLLSGEPPEEESSSPAASTAAGKSQQDAAAARDQSKLQDISKTRTRREDAQMKQQQQKQQQQQQQQQDNDDDVVDPKDPWKQARSRGPGEDWQPEAWSPKTKK